MLDDAAGEPCRLDINNISLLIDIYLFAVAHFLYYDLGILDFVNAYAIGVIAYFILMCLRYVITVCWQTDNLCESRWSDLLWGLLIDLNFIFLISDRLFDL